MKYAALSSGAGYSNAHLQGIVSKYYDVYFNFAIEYDNLGLTVSDFKMICAIICGFCIGMIIAVFSSLYTKRVLGDLVRATIAADALSPESAKTLYELGFDNKLLLRRAVAKSVSLRRVLKCREEEDFIAELNAKREEYAKKREDNGRLPKFKESEYKIDPSADAFFIPEELKYTAEIKFDKKGASVRSAIATSIIVIIAFIAVMIALPELLEFLDGLAV